MYSILRNNSLNILLILKKQIIDYIRFEFYFLKHGFFKINNIIFIKNSISHRFLLVRLVFL